MVLKAEFTSDMARVTEMQHIKEAELLGRIDRGEEELSKRTFEKGCDKQIESKILE